MRTTLRCSGVFATPSKRSRCRGRNGIRFSSRFVSRAGGGLHPGAGLLFRARPPATGTGHTLHAGRPKPQRRPDAAVAAAAEWTQRGFLVLSIDRPYHGELAGIPGDALRKHAAGQGVARARVRSHEGGRLHRYQSQAEADRRSEQPFRRPFSIPAKTSLSGRRCDESPWRRAAPEGSGSGNAAAPGRRFPDRRCRP